jgi:hypothetical protein
VGYHPLDPQGRDELWALPGALVQHQLPDASDGASGVVSPAPGGHHLHAVDVKRPAVADLPFLRGDADRLHDALAEQTADVRLWRTAQASGDGIGQRRHAWVAVGQSGTRGEEHGRLVQRDRERVWILPPEGALPAIKLIVRLPASLGVFHARGVSCQVTYGDHRSLRVTAPTRDVLAGRVIDPDVAVAERHQERHPAHQRLRQRGGVVATVRIAPRSIPLPHDLVVPHHQEGLCAPLGEVVRQHSQSRLVQVLVPR